MITKLTTKITPNLIKVLSLIFATVILMAAFALPKIANAATVSFSLSASASSVEKNDNFVITARVNVTSGSITDILGNVNYDSSKVQYVSISYTGGGGTTAGPSAYASGSTYRTVDAIKTSSNLTGNFTVANITFKALKSSGSASFSISGASYGDGDTPTSGSPSVSGTSVSMTAPPEPEPEPEPKPKSSTPSSSKPSSSNSTSPTTTSSGDPTEEEVEQNSELDDDQPVEINEDFVDQTTYVVEILVTDDQGNPVKDAEVTIGEQTSRTNEEGIASFAGLKQGSYEVNVLGETTDITVNPGDPNNPQNFTVVDTPSETNTTLYIIAGVVFILLVAGVLGIRQLMNRNRRNNKPPEDPGSNETGSNNTPGSSDEYMKPNPPDVETVVEPTTEQG